MIIISIIVQTYAVTLVDAAVDNTQHLEIQLNAEASDNSIRSNTSNQESVILTKLLSRHELEIVNPKNSNFISKVVSKSERIDELILWTCICAGILTTFLLALYLICITECKSKDSKTAFSNSDELKIILLKQ